MCNIFLVFWNHIGYMEVEGWQRLRWLDSITDSMDTNLAKLRGIVKDGEGGLACCSPWGRRVRHDLVTEQQKQVEGFLFCRLTGAVVKLSQRELSWNKLFHFPFALEHNRFLWGFFFTKLVAQRRSSFPESNSLLFNFSMSYPIIHELRLQW